MYLPLLGLLEFLNSSQVMTSDRHFIKNQHKKQYLPSEWKART